jgi:hypothetical protein
MSGAKLEADRGVHGVQEVVCIVPADRPENLPDDTSLDTFFFVLTWKLRSASGVSYL